MSLFFTPPFPSSFYSLSSAFSSYPVSSLRVIPLLGLCWFSRRFVFKTLTLLVYLSVFLFTWMSYVYPRACFVNVCLCVFLCFLNCFFSPIRNMFPVHIPDQSFYQLLTRLPRFPSPSTRTPKAHSLTFNTTCAAKLNSIDNSMTDRPTD